MTRAGTATVLRAAATGALASPIGTPQLNAPRHGKGMAVDLPFGRHRDAMPPTVFAADGTSGIAAPPAPRRHLTQSEWRKNYIARHGHDLTAPARSGH